jgi:hypothetical protein
LGTNGKKVLVSTNGGATTTVFDFTTLPMPSTGSYQSIYNTAATLHITPLSQATQAAYNFFNILNGGANCNFGFIAFSDGIGSAPTSQWKDGQSSGGTLKTTNLNVAGIYTPYPAGGTGVFPLPYVQLNPANNNFPTLTGPATTPGSIYSLVATGKTDISDALAKALSDLTPSNNVTRTNARRAIVLFTDGEPNLPAPDFATNQATCNSLADTAAAANIPIYCIGLSQNPALVNDEFALLGNQTGITAHDKLGQYVSVTNPSQLSDAFETVARTLVVLK